MNPIQPTVHFQPSQISLHSLEARRFNDATGPDPCFAHGIDRPLDIETLHFPMSIPEDTDNADTDTEVPDFHTVQSLRLENLEANRGFPKLPFCWENLTNIIHNRPSSVYYPTRSQP